MEFIENFPFSLMMLPYVGLIVNMYGLAVGLSLFYGMYSGFSEWVCWMENHKPIKLQKKTQWLEPIVNTTRNSGYFVWNVITYAVSTTFIAATFPVSVPMLTLFFADKEVTTSSTKGSDTDSDTNSDTSSDDEPPQPKRAYARNR